MSHWSRTTEQKLQKPFSVLFSVQTMKDRKAASEA